MKKINVFISSTFKDLEDERNQLMIVFREAEKYAAENLISLKEFDYRWGLPKGANVMKACLESIRISKPYFLCILGDRYGSQTKEEYYEKEKGFLEEYNEFIETEVISEKPENNLSFTAMEIHYVLKEKYDNNSVRFFHLSYKNNIEPKQQELIDTIKAKGYTLIECDSPKELMDGIRDFLMGIIKAASIINDLEDESEDEKIFLSSDGNWNSQYKQLKFYQNTQQSILNSLVFDSYQRSQEKYLNSFLVSPSNVCCIVGEDGVGKSTFLAQWINSKMNCVDSNIKIIYHFYQEQYIDDLFEHLYLEIAELNKRSIEDYYANLFGSSRNFPKAIKIFDEAMKQLESNETIVVIIDGLEHSIIDFSSFFDTFANNNKSIKLILTTGTVPIDSSKVDTIELPSLNKDEMESIACNYFLQHHKSEEESKRISDGLAKNQMLHNPNLLMSILFDIRAFANFDNIESVINAYVKTSNPYEVYEIIVNHWKSKIPVLDNNDVLAWLAYSNCGLSEEDIKIVAGINDKNEWNFILSLLQPYMEWNGDRLEFKNEFLKQTIINNSIAAEDNIKDSMISYFKDKNMPIEKQFDELPFLYKNLQMRAQLLSYLLDLSVFKYVIESENHNKLRFFIDYWSTFDISDFYDYIYSNHSFLSKKEYVLLLIELADFLYFHAAEMFPYIEHKRQSKEFIHSVICEAAINELDEDTEKEIDQNKIANLYRVVAVSYIDSNKTEKARNLLAKAINILSAQVEQKWNYYEISLLTQRLHDDKEDKITGPLVQSMMRSSLLDALNPYILLLGEMLNTGLKPKEAKKYYDEAIEWIEKLVKVQGDSYSLDIKRSNVDYAYGMCLYDAKKYKAAFGKFNNSFNLKFDYLIRQEKNQDNDPYLEYRLMETYKMIQSCQISEGGDELYSNQKRYVDAVEKYGMKYLNHYFFLSCIYNNAAFLYNQSVNKEDSEVTHLLQDALKYYEKVISYSNDLQENFMYIKASFYKMICLARLNQDEEVPSICKSIFEREKNLTNDEKQDAEMQWILNNCHQILK